MASLKNITELPVAESADGLNLIVNDNGAAKQIAASAVGAQADWSVTDENSPAFIKNKPEQVQPDWSQNDPTKPDYVKNKTHWEEEVVVVVVPEQTLEGFSPMQGPIYAIENAFYMEPVIGNTYTVTWDGNSYDVVFKDAYGFGYMGNKNYFDMMSGGDIPFAIIFAGAIFVATESTAPSHTISITTAKHVVHKLDAKFLPDGVSGGYDLVLETDAFSIDADMTKESISIISGSNSACVEKIKNGGVCRAVLRVREAYGDEMIDNFDIECIVLLYGYDNVSVCGMCYNGQLRSFSIYINDSGIERVSTEKYDPNV